MRKRDRIRIVQISMIAVFAVWGLFAGLSAGSKYQEQTDWPFSEVSMIAIAVLVLCSVLLAIAPVTRGMARAVAISAAAFTLSVVLGHLLGNKGPGGPEVPRNIGRGQR
jgi:hypothetical protein